MRIVFTAILVLALALSACSGNLLGTGTNTTMNDTDEPITMPDAPAPTDESMDESMDEPMGEPDLDEMAEPVDTRFTVTKTEGELIVLKPQAVDPDGDEIQYAFTPPFDREGEWQTTYGDAGDYDVMITATDEQGATSSVEIRVVVLAANRPPSLSCPERIVVREGEEVMIDCAPADTEGDEFTVSYTGWMTGATRQTGYDDAGEHVVTVTAADAGGSTSATVLVEVQEVNRAPVFPADFPATIVAQEGDVLTLDTGMVTDPDGDEVQFTFSEPFNEKGIWRTGEGDAGRYTVDVVATDGDAIAKRRVTIELDMVNTAPMLQPIEDITVTEGETVSLPIAATDREGDELAIDIDGWMESAEYTTTFDDAGEYTVRVAVSDGELTDSQIVHITVLDKNRPPVFKMPA